MTEGPAIFFDGVRAGRQPVQVSVSSASLVLRAPAGETLAEWPLAALRIIDQAPGLLRLAPATGDARLEVADPALSAALLSAIAASPRAPARWWLRAAAIAAVALAGVWFGGPLLADGLARLVPAPIASTLGDAAVAELKGEDQFCTGAAGQAAVDRLAARLATAAGVPTPRVQVIDSKVINAFAAPGGRVILTRGVIAAVPTPEGLAGVMAHEFGHVHENHGMRGVARAAGLHLLATVATGNSGLGSAGAGLASIANTRAFERAADAEAVRILGNAGFGTGGLRDFLAGIDKLSGAQGFLNTHPESSERVKAIPLRPGTEPVMPPADWTAIRGMC
jgi:beta-barrel assembly-enhancing protease